VVEVWICQWFKHDGRSWGHRARWGRWALTERWRDGGVVVLTDGGGIPAESGEGAD
jgi:hypothetical protein